MKRIIKKSSVILVLLVIISVIIYRNIDKKSNYIQENETDNTEIEFDDYSVTRFIEEYMFAEEVKKLYLKEYNK